MTKRISNKLKKMVNVYGIVDGVNELGEVEKRYDIIKNISAAIIPQTASLQKQQADTILANVTHKVIVRHGSGKDITNDMKLKYRDKTFDIKYILNPYFNNEFLEIFCSELIE